MKAYRAFLRLGAHRHGYLARFGELHRVADQVDKNLAQARHVAFDPIRHAVVNPVAEVDGLRCRTVGEQLKRLFDAGRDLESVCLQLEIAGLNLGEVENVIDHRQQRIATHADGFNIVALLGGELGVEQQARHPDHRVHGRANFMAHVSEKGGFGAVGGLGGETGALCILEEPCIFDRHGGLVGECLQAHRILLRKEANVRRHNGQKADDLASRPDGGAEKTVDPFAVLANDPVGIAMDVGAQIGAVGCQDDLQICGRRQIVAHGFEQLVAIDYSFKT